MSKIKAGILGCTGLVGQQFVRMLAGHPYFEIAVLASSTFSAGKKYREAADWSLPEEMPEEVKDMTLSEVSPEILIDSGVKIFFSALPAETAKDIEIPLSEKGVFIFSNARANRMISWVPILIPEVNPGHIDLISFRPDNQKGFIITNSNCSTTGLAMTLKPLQKFGIRSIVVSTYQAVSGAGRQGLSSLDILGNVIPWISGEEDKMEKETQKIFGKIIDGKITDSQFDIMASCCRVPVRDGHLENVSVQLKENAGESEILSAFRSFQGIPQELNLPSAPEKPLIVREEPDRPQPLLDLYAGNPQRAKGMAVTVGRIRKRGRKISFALLVNNTIRGAAGTCVLNAELALVKNKIKVRQDPFNTRRDYS